jgi:RNA polymerase sigma factor (sigma-70 family)
MSHSGSKRGGTPAPKPPSDAAEVSALLQGHLPRLHAYVRLHMDRTLRAREESGDLVQSTCREVLEHARTFRFEGEAGFRRWLCTVALNKVRERLRFHHAGKRDARREERGPADAGSSHERSLLECYATLATPSREAGQREQVLRIEAAFDRLPEAWRDVVAQNRILGMSHGEIAAMTGKTEVAVRSLLHRALVKLSALLAEGDVDHRGPARA